MASISGYGNDFEKRLSRKQALRLIKDLGIAFLPLMGREVILKSVPLAKAPSVLDEISIQNVSGDFVVASSSTPLTEWKEVFGEALEPQYIVRKFDAKGGCK